MKLYLSTTFHGKYATELADVLNMVSTLDLDGLELGSTHKPIANPEVVVGEHYQGTLVTHNFFPAAADKNFVVNIAAIDEVSWHASVDYAKDCISVAASLGAHVYTIHPGFMAKPKIADTSKSNYDFEFSQDIIDHDTAFERMFSALRELVPHAISSGVKLALETEGSLTKQGMLLMECLEEYDALFKAFPRDLYLNFNLAHSRFAAMAHDYSLGELIQRYYDKIVLIEVSHNDGHTDQHKPLVTGSYVFDWLDVLPDVPLILEFRNATINQIKQSIILMRDHTPRSHL